MRYKDILFNRITSIFHTTITLLRRFISWEIFRGQNVVNTLSADCSDTGQIYITGTGGVAHTGLC